MEWIPTSNMLRKREMEVLRDIVKNGYVSPYENGRRLYISSTTYRDHWRNIFRKLEVHNKVDAVVKAVRIGLIPPIETEYD